MREGGRRRLGDAVPRLVLLSWVVAACGDSMPAAAERSRAHDREAAPIAAPEPAALAPAEHSTEPDADAEQSTITAREPAPSPEAARWIAIGGGAVPEATQVQIEQDVALAIEVLGEHGIVRFGAGAGAPVVQEQLAAPMRDPIGVRLADLFDGRGGRDARYRAPRIRVDGPATADDVLALLERAIAAPGDPLLVFVAGHGEIGPTPNDNTISLWGTTSITPHRLGAVLDRAARTTRMVATTCFSGGFAELAFAGGHQLGGAPATTRCGLFATTWDLEASGCDPNPDRAAQEGYALHFLEALRGRDRDGNPLALAELDFDRDGTIGLLDAHTHVVIASQGPDVPTTTSERWLREHAPLRGPSEPADVPEDEAVIAALTARLGLVGRGQEAGTRLAELEQRIADAQVAIDDADAKQVDAIHAAEAELLARWPILDDPWHPDFATVFRHEREAIGALLERSTSYAAYVAARDALAEAEAHAADLAVAAAPFERLVRALENRRRAEHLTAQGGDALATWRRIRACERMPP